MWTLILEGLRGVWLRLAAVAAAGVALFALWQKAKQTGRKDLEHEQMEFAFEQAQRRKETEHDVRALPPDDLDKRLQPYYRD